jgi:hypothetical protein
VSCTIDANPGITSAQSLKSENIRVDLDSLKKVLNGIGGRGFMVKKNT